MSDFQEAMNNFLEGSGTFSEEVTMVGYENFELMDWCVKKSVEEIISGFAPVVPVYADEQLRGCRPSGVVHDDPVDVDRLEYNFTDIDFWVKGAVEEFTKGIDND